MLYTDGVQILKIGGFQVDTVSVLEEIAFKSQEDGKQVNSKHTEHHWGSVPWRKIR
jgi:hypothetical protein